jgi:LPXTG-site transpeptidase (sortase) family protein
MFQFTEQFDCIQPFELFTLTFPSWVLTKIVFMISYVSSMHKRFLALAVIVALVGVMTQAFAQNAPVLGNPTITRAGAVALLVEANPMLKARLAHHIKHPAPMPLFDDIDYEGWYTPYVETAFEGGIISGNEERRFRPQDLLLQEEAITLGARFHAIKNADMNDDIATTSSGSWFGAVLTASAANGLTLPNPVQVGTPISRSDFFALMTSMGIQNADRIAVSNAPAPVIVAIPPRANGGTTPRPTVARPTPAAPAAQPVGVQPSAKSFAITIPSLGITDLTITHPSDPFSKDGLHAPLQTGVGHLFSYPGKGGKILVYGHSSSVPWDVSNYAKIFRQINKLNPGDKIYITHGGKVHTYEVTYKNTVPANDMSAYNGGGGEELILYTCWPPDSIKERYLVHAKPV